MGKFRQGVQGSISIFLVLVLVPLLSGTFLAVDAGRTAVARSKAEAALNLTGNAALNNYTESLKDAYGLFAMGESASAMETELSAVFSGMVDAAEEPVGNVMPDNFLNTKTRGFAVSFPEDASLARPEVLEATITDYMKYRGPYGFARGVSQKIGAFRSVKEASNVLEKSEDYYKSLSGVQKKLSGLAGTLSETSEEEEKVQALLSGLSDLETSVAKTEAPAKAWKDALSKVSDGNTRTLLYGDYKNTAELLDRSGVEALREKLTKDLETLNASSEAHEDADGELSENSELPETTQTPESPELLYKTDPVYLYMTGSVSGGSSEEQRAAGGVKTSLEALAGTDRKLFVSGVPEVSVERTLGASMASSLDAVGGNGADSPDSVKTFFSALSGATDSFLSDSYNEEFLTEMFSAYTSLEGAKNPAGLSLSGRPLFRGETEYILFGKDYLPTNVALAADLIFMVRVLFNSIFVFSNAKLRAEAFSLATAVAGFTGAGVSVVQHGLLLALATAESVADLSTLMKGKAVPLFKNAATWTLGFHGVEQKLKEGAVNLVSQTVDDVYARVEKTAEDHLEELEQTALRFFRETTEGAVESLTNQIVVPVESTLTALFSSASSGTVSYSRQEIRERIVAAVNGADNGSAGFAAARKAFLEVALDPLTDTAFQNLQNLSSLPEELKETVPKAIADGIKDAYSTLFTEVQKATEQKVSSLENSLHQALKTGGSEVKGEVIEVLNAYEGRLSKYLGSSAETSGGAALSSGSGLSLSYQDYLKVFVFVGLLKNSVKTGMLTRAAKVMQINCKTLDSHFSMPTTFRAIKLSGTVGVGTHTVKRSETYGY